MSNTISQVLNQSLQGMHCTYLEVLGQILSQDRSEGESNIATHSHPDGGRVRGCDRRVKLSLKLYRN